MSTYIVVGGTRWPLRNKCTCCLDQARACPHVDFVHTHQTRSRHAGLNIKTNSEPQLYQFGDRSKHSASLLLHCVILPDKHKVIFLDLWVTQSCSLLLYIIQIKWLSFYKLYECFMYFDLSPEYVNQLVKRFDISAGQPSGQSVGLVIGRLQVQTPELTRFCPLGRH